MASRFYFSGAQAADVSPAFNAGWNYTTEAVRRKLLQAKEAGEAIATGTLIGTWTANEVALDRQYISDPMAAQQLSGTVKCQIQSREGQSTDNVKARFAIYVCSEDGSTIKDTLLMPS
jgi:hypothetical protein